MSTSSPRTSKERELGRRVAELESRVVWLEEMLTRVLGAPVDHAQAATAVAAPAAAPVPPIVPNPALDRFLLRTQPMRALFVPLDASLENTQPNTTQGQTLEPFTLDLDQTLGASIAAPAQEDKFIPNDFAPAAAARNKAAQDKAAQEKRAVSLGITAAFSTLEDKIAMAADAELAVAVRRRPAAPSITLMPEMAATAGLPRLLEVCCALETLNPSILQQIMAIWHLPECAARLHRLVAEDDGRRMGLDPAVRDELSLLALVRDDLIRATH